MKCAVVLSEGIKQIMFTPENDSEKMALKFITADDDITVEIKNGVFMNTTQSLAGYKVQSCQGGYLRAWEHEDSLMLVLRRKEVKDNDEKEKSNE